MAFADYLDLRTAVIEEVGDPSIADIFDRLTKLAEARFNRELRTNDQITSTTVTFTAGVAALPADFQEAIGLYDANGYEYVQQPLQAVQPTGNCYYAIQGGNIVTAAADATRTLHYYASIPTITTSMTTTNWLLTGFPSVYLYGVAAEAEKRRRNVDEAIALTRLMDIALDEVRGDDTKKRYSRARVRVGGPTP